MVYCTRCGTRNDDTARNCTNCGAPLYTVGEQYPGSERESYRRVEHECFGIPNGTMIVAVIVGLIVIIWGLTILLQTMYNIAIDIWPLVLIIVGVLIVIAAVYGRQRRWSSAR
jgi:uncharacterized membrane protein YvbJ